jgi:hypothetical protein
MDTYTTMQGIFFNKKIEGRCQLRKSVTGTMQGIGILFPGILSPPKFVNYTKLRLAPWTVDLPHHTIGCDSARFFGKYLFDIFL